METSLPVIGRSPMVRASVGGGRPVRQLGKPSTHHQPIIRRKEVYGGGHRRHSYQPIKSKQYHGLSPSSPLNKVKNEIKMKSYQEIYNSTMEAMNQGYPVQSNYNGETSTSPTNHFNKKKQAWKPGVKRTPNHFKEAVMGVSAHPLQRHTPEKISKSFITGSPQKTMNSMMALDNSQAQHPSVRAQSTEYQQQQQHQQQQLNDNVDQTMKHLKQKLEHRRASTSVLQHFESQQVNKTRPAPSTRPSITKQTYQSQLIRPDQDMAPSVKKLQYQNTVPSPLTPTTKETTRRHSYSSTAMFNMSPSKSRYVTSPSKKDKNHKIPSIKMLTAAGKKKVINAKALEKASHLLGIQTEKTVPTHVEARASTSPPGMISTPPHMFNTSIVTPDSSPSQKEASSAGSPEVMYPTSPLIKTPTKRRKKKKTLPITKPPKTRTPEPIKTENVQPLMLIQEDSPPIIKKRKRRTSKDSKLKMEISSSTATETSSTIMASASSPPPQIVELRKAILHGGHWYLKPIKKRLLIEHWLDEQAAYARSLSAASSTCSGGSTSKKRRSSKKSRASQQMLNPMMIQTLSHRRNSKSPRQIRLDRLKEKAKPGKKVRQWH